MSRMSDTGLRGICTVTGTAERQGWSRLGVPGTTDPAWIGLIVRWHCTCGISQWGGLGAGDYERCVDPGRNFRSEPQGPGVRAKRRRGQSRCGRR
jgi:hypothetical protein